MINVSEKTEIGQGGQAYRRLAIVLIPSVTLVTSSLMLSEAFAGIKNGSQNVGCLNVSYGNYCEFEYPNVYYSLNPYLSSTNPSGQIACVGFYDPSSGTLLCQDITPGNYGDGWSCSTCPGTVYSHYESHSLQTVNIYGTDYYTYCSSQPCPTNPSS